MFIVENPFTCKCLLIMQSCMFFTVPFIYGMNSIATLFNLSYWVAIEFILYRLICYYRLKE